MAAAAIWDTAADTGEYSDGGHEFLDLLETMTLNYLNTRDLDAAFDVHEGIRDGIRHGIAKALLNIKQ